MRGQLGESQDAPDLPAPLSQADLALQTVEAIEQAVIVTDLDGCIRAWNVFAEGLYGWPRAEVLGRHIVDVTSTARSRAQITELLAQIARGEKWSGILLVQRRDGSAFWAQMTGVPLYDVQGRLTGSVGLSADITERLQAEAEHDRLNAGEQVAHAEAQAALQARDRFLALAAHELRTPLTTILGFAQLLEKSVTLGIANPEQAGARAALIVRHARRLDALIDYHLDVVKLQRGEFDVHLQPLDLRTIVDLVVGDVRLNLDKALHQIVVIQPAHAVIVAGDPLRLEQVLQNLLSNAIKYSPAGGPITVRMTQRTSEVVLDVVDTGIGIPIQAQPHLFEPFFRAHNAGPGTSGLGIGLYVVREIVRRHTGAVQVYSVPGAGSIFRIVLPLHHPT